MWKKITILFLVVVLTGCAAAALSPEALNRMTSQELDQLCIKLLKDSKGSDPEQVLQYSDLAISKDPYYGRAYYTKGSAYYNLGKHDLAIENFTKAIELDPAMVEAYDSRGWVYYTVNNHEAAVKDFTRAIEINPKYKKAYSSRAAAYLKMNRNEEACADLQRVCDMGDCSNLEEARKAGQCK